MSHTESLPSFSPQLQLETLFVLDDEGRILGTREPQPSRGPAFALVRSEHACAWAVNVSVPPEAASQLEVLARDEPPTVELNDPPLHAEAYLTTLKGKVDSGPVFTFPVAVAPVKNVEPITSIKDLAYHFRGWTLDEIPDRSPIVGIRVDGQVVSVCFCARRSETAAEAGVETAVQYRGRGFASQVTAAWARLIHDSDRVALYSTSWSNIPSLGVARALGLTACAVDWNVYAGAG